MRTVKVQRVYLAGNLQDHEKFRNYVSEIERLGFKVVSTWHADGHLFEELGSQPKMTGNKMAATMDSFRELMTQKAPASPLDKVVTQCKNELKLADIVIAFASGGSFEAGYALAQGKRVILVGESTSLFAHELAKELRPYKFYVAEDLEVLKLLLLQEVRKASQPPLRAFMSGNKN